ncbi:MAG: GAF domain-containing protein [Clostridia bacterium]|nr:GAF domain-containing protein [Clostridia bacterium]
METDFCGYDMLAAKLRSLVSGERNPLPNLSNAAALLRYSLTDISWAGFYISDAAEEELILGPFQGKPACIRIKYGRGVCGTAAAYNKTVRVDNVHEFEGHIACDAESNSEIVLPLHDAGGNVVGVLDIDSTKFSRFSEDDERGLLEFAAILESACDWGMIS